MDDPREELAHFLQSQARATFHAAKREGDSEQLTESAQRLRALAAYIRRLDDDDRVLLIWAATQAAGEIRGEALERAAARLGEHSGDPEGMLEALVEAALADWRQYSDDLGVDGWITLVTHPEPRVALAAIGALNYWSSDLEQEPVIDARRCGMSWAEIANLLGRSKQAVWEKYRRLDPMEGIG